MKKLLAILLLTATSAMADTNLWFATVTLTNLPVTSNGLIFTQPVAVSVLFSNNATSATVLTNTSIGGATTNLFLHFAGYSSTRYARLAPKLLGSNVIQLSGLVDQPIAFTATGNWCSLVITSRPLTKMTAVRTPISSEGTNAVSIASSLVNDLGNLPTNSIPTNAPILQKYADLTSVQTLQKKLLTNATLAGVKMTNSQFSATNSYCSNCTADAMSLSNSFNHGTAFSSPGTNTGSEQFGSGANAQGAYSTAVGNTAVASGDYSIALGAGSAPTAYKSIAIGNGSQADGTNSIGIGVGSSASKYNAIAIGKDAQSVHSNSVAIGVGAVTTAESQIMLGTATVGVQVNGILQSGSISNNILTGTNVFRGTIAFTPGTVSTLVNGNNAGVELGTNTIVLLSGATTYCELAGFKPKESGRVHWLRLTGAATNYVVNYTGSSRATDGAAANRIETGTGGDLTLTNNPAWLQVYYDTTVSRWQVINSSR